MNEINRAYDQICEYRRTGRWPWENPRRSARQTYGYQTAYAASGDGTGTRNTAGGGGYYAYGASAGPGRPKPRRRPLLILWPYLRLFLSDCPFTHPARLPLPCRSVRDTRSKRKAAALEPLRPRTTGWKRRIPPFRNNSFPRGIGFRRTETYSR